MYIQPNRKFTGLHVHCRECGTLIDTGICKQTGRPIQKGGCPHPDKHVFKAIVHIAKSKNGRKAKILKSTTYEGAIKELLAFKESLKEKELAENIAAIETIGITPDIKERGRTNRDRPTTLHHCMARYVGYLHGDPEIVPVFKRKKRSKGHLEDVERTFLRLMTALKRTGRKVSELHIDDINDELIGEFYEYLTETLKLGNAGYNRALTNLTTFYNYLISEGYTRINPFESIVRKPLRANVDTITKEQFDALCAIIQKPELGMREHARGIRKNLYKPWLKDAIELGLYTGRRREEIVRMQWKDIIYEDHKAQAIVIPDYKVNRQKGLAIEDWIYHYVPVTGELSALLERLGEKKHHGTDAYILAPDETMSRDSMRSLLSKSFSHYYAQLGYDKQLRFGCLRKTNFSSLSAQFGMENAQAVSGHSGTAVMKKHYISKKVLAKAAQEFTVFEKEKERTRQEALGAARGEKDGISIER